MAQTCVTCQYFEAKDNGVGLCKRNPPTIVLDADSADVFEVTAEYFGRWPLVTKIDWCGEHKDSGRIFAKELQKAIQNEKKSG